MTLSSNRIIGRLCCFARKVWSMTSEQRRASSTDGDRKGTPGGWKFAGATLLVLGATATFAPMLAAAMLGFSLNWDGTRSTGGVLALVASIVMGLTCRDWETWRKWIWLPVAITIVIAFVVVNFYVSDASG